MSTKREARSPQKLPNTFAWLMCICVSFCVIASVFGHYTSRASVATQESWIQVGAVGNQLKVAESAVNEAVAKHGRLAILTQRLIEAAKADPALNARLTIHGIYLTERPDAKQAR